MWVAAIAIASMGCSGGPGEIADAGPDVVYGKKPIDAGFPEAKAAFDCNAGNTPSATYPAPHPPLAALTSSGGPVLASPRFVPIVFTGEDRTSDIATFTSRLTTSNYWTSTIAQYGVGAATAVAPIIVDETPPAEIEDADIQTWLQGKLDGTHADFGAPDSSSIYILFYPTATTVDTPWGSSCQAFDGYHSESKVGATKIVYAVINRCDAMPMSAITAHELFEASTDPFIYSAPAYIRLNDPDDYAVQEIGDLCEFEPDFMSTELSYLVPPMWSNASLNAGHWPCVPPTASNGSPNFRTIADVDDWLEDGTTRGLKLAAGETRTIVLVAFSDQPTDPWQVSAQASYGSWQDQMTLSLCRSTAQNGVLVPLTITRPATSTQNDDVEITSTLNGVTTTYDFLVGD